jgi:hypothetical protein
MSTHENTSDVAQLLQRIDVANEAAHHALYGLAAGSARHDFISAKLKYIGRCHEQLAELVGKDEAAALVCRIIDHSGERHGQEKGLILTLVLVAKSLPRARVFFTRQQEDHRGEIARGSGCAVCPHRQRMHHI